MKYTKPFLSINQQIKLLQDRGLIIDDIPTAKHNLQHISYYRLSAYMLPFKKDGEDIFKDGTTFESIIDVYFFDKKLRMLTFDAIEKIEVSLRAVMTYVMSDKHGANWFEKECLFENKNSYLKIIETIKSNTIEAKQKDVFVKHYFEKYDTPEIPPSWLTLETLSFGSISFIFKSLKKHERRRFEQYVKHDGEILKSWFHALTYTRNISAHHSRLWNREFMISTKVDKAINEKLNGNFKKNRRKFYAQAFVIYSLLKTIAPNNHWCKNLYDLFQKHPNINIEEMGFTKDFKNFSEFKNEKKK